MKLSSQNLSKKIKNRLIVDQVNITIHSGEIIGLLGPNGAGKTTSFYMLLGLVSPDTGSIYINNIDVTKLPIHARAKLGIAYLPQEASIFRGLSVRDNILGVLELQQISKTEQTTRLYSLLKEFNLTHIETSLGISLSGGERRRVEIARALATNPKFILLDEPFAGVDPKSIIDIKQLITYLASKDIGVLITDHNVRDTLDICHKIYVLNGGQVISQGSPQEIALNEQVKKTYLGEEFRF